MPAFMNEMVVELNTVDLKRAVRRANPAEAVARKVALKRQVVNSEDAGRPLAAPSDVSRSECRRPVIHVQDVSCPVAVYLAAGQFGRGQTEPGKPQIVACQSRFSGSPYGVPSRSYSSGQSTTYTVRPSGVSNLPMSHAGIAANASQRPTICRVPQRASSCL